MQHQQIPQVDSLPITRPEGCPFDPPSELARIREESPITRMAYPDGHVGWLVTGHAMSRAVFADPRFSSRYELMHYLVPGAGITEIPPAPVGDLVLPAGAGGLCGRRLPVVHRVPRRRRGVAVRGDRPGLHVAQGSGRAISVQTVPVADGPSDRG
jgi:hypothetical protein